MRQISHQDEPVRFAEWRAGRRTISTMDTLSFPVISEARSKTP